tara:strand:+ start:2261 stop:4387 length:2127 start_codon:yes stop_codon:yes gene_type:complete
MATPQLSPGLVSREIDLTVGRVDNVIDITGAFAGPFSIGPVDEPINISSEKDLISVFGKPSENDSQFEYWMSASTYLSYGGNMSIIRTSGSNLKNANDAGVSSTIKNYDDYQLYHTDASDYSFIAKNPGTWANGMKVCVVDDFADQIIGINTDDLGSAGAAVGYGVTAPISNAIIPGSGSTTPFSGHIKGIITSVNDSASSDSTITVKVVSRVSSSGEETAMDYIPMSNYAAFSSSANVTFVDNSGSTAGSSSVESVSDWYDNQTLSLTNNTIYWKSIAPKPTSNNYVLSRQGKSDSMHVVVVDDLGTVTGVRGSILEKHLGLSKAKDSISSSNAPQKNYFKAYLADFSENIYCGGKSINKVATSFSTGYTPASAEWGEDAQGSIFKSAGNLTFTFSGGEDYSSDGGMDATLSDLMNSYSLFLDEAISLDFVIMGPGLVDRFESQAKANYIISIAEQRKDCMAVVGPHYSDLVGQSNPEVQTDNLISYFGSIASSSYAVFDSGYKYTYDRFNNKFRYIACNADVAGIMARTNLESFPWFSPAGENRGVLNNAIKLAYNPSKSQRDRLYPQRINSFVTQSGKGTFLFGDKTALSYPSAFDRINVRRLFLTIEQALESAAQAQLFELNDDLTRSSFLNIVEPYLRDVQSNRGLSDFVVVCDSTNNTPDVIDNNEFRADIFLKPLKSINYITLTFVATRTGVSFEEVTGRA